MLLLGFVLFGTQGFVSFFERSDDKREPFVESRRLLLGGSISSPTARPDAVAGSNSNSNGGGGSHSTSAGYLKDEFEVVTSACVLPSEETVVMLCKSNRVLSLPMTGVDLVAATAVDTASIGFGSIASKTPSAAFSISTSPLTDLFHGGGHQSKIVGLDIAVQRPIAMTISADSSARVWNFETFKCELVHDFRADDQPLALSVLYTGMQVLISFKDRVRLYNILHDKLRVYRETSLKSCKEIKFSNGGQLWAGASTLSVMVYDTKSFHQLLCLQGHMMTVRRISWAPGDQMLFSAGQDGNVYGWSLQSDARLDVSTSANR